MVQYLDVESFDLKGGTEMMTDPLALDLQRQGQAALRRRVACGPAATRGPKPPREAHRRYAALRRFTTATTSG